jgi:hypothetical protein
MIILSDMNGMRLVVKVDPQRPGAWREEPYYSQLKKWSKEIVPHGGQVLIYVNNKTHAILPDKDVDLGVFAHDELIAMRKTITPSGISFEVFKIKNDDPRAQHLVPQNREISSTSE